METLSQAPHMSEVRIAKSNAMQSAFENIETMAGKEGGNEKKAVIAQQLLEELRSSQNLEGKSAYRMEQALAKLVEYFQMEAELVMRKEELVSIFPGLATKLSGNDTGDTVSSDDKYKVV